MNESERNKMKLAIYGSGGLGREVFFLAETVMRHSSPYSELLFIDDTKPAGYFCSRAMCPFDDFAEKYSPEDTHVVIAVGEPAQRKILAEKIAAAHYRLGRLISPDLQQSSDIEIGAGCLVFPGSILLPGVTIGENTVLQSGIVLTHDDRIGRNSVLSPRAVLGGAVSVGDNCYIGLAAAIRDHVSIGTDCIVGMGAVVTGNVEANSVVAGNPARKIRDNLSKTVFHKQS